MSLPLPEANLEESLTVMEAGEVVNISESVTTVGVHVL